MATEKMTFEEYANSREDLRAGVIPRSGAWSSDYDHLGVHSQDIAQMIALDMQANAGSYVLGKTIAAGAFAFGPGAGALALLGMNAAQDMWAWYKNTNVDRQPSVFWEEFQNKMAEAKEENSTLDDFMEGFQTRMSYIGGAATGETIGPDGKPQTGQTPFGPMPEITTAHRMGDMLGYVVRDASYMLATGEWGLIGLSALHNGMHEYTQELGLGHNAADAAKSGLLHGLVTGATGLTFMKLLPGASEKIGSYFANGNTGTIFQKITSNPVVESVGFGAEFAAWGGSEEMLLAMADGRDNPVTPTQLGVMFGAGMALGGLGSLGKWFKARKTQSGETAADAYKAVVTIPSRSQGLTPYYEGIDLSPEMLQNIDPKSLVKFKPRYKQNGTFLDVELSPQETALLADEVRDLALQKGFQNVVAGDIVREVLQKRGQEYYHVINAEKLLNKFTRMNPNITNRDSFLRTSVDWVDYERAKILNPKTQSPTLQSPMDVLDVGSDGVHPFIDFTEKGNYFVNREKQLTTPMR
jgi:hypothetical protein